MELGLGGRYVDGRRRIQVSDYTELDARLAWKPTPNCEIAVISRSLLHAHHQEAAPPAISPKDVEVDRAIYARLTLRF